MAALSFCWKICVVPATSCLGRHVLRFVSVCYLPLNQCDFFGARLAILRLPLDGRG